MPEENIERAAWRARVDAGRSQQMELESLAGSDLGDCQGLERVRQENSSSFRYDE